MTKVFASLPSEYVFLGTKNRYSIMVESVLLFKLKVSPFNFEKRENGFNCRQQYIKSF